MNDALIKKMGINNRPRKAILNKPEDINYFSGLDYDTSIKTPPYDAIVLFIETLTDYDKFFKTMVEKQQLTLNGYLCVAYPKKGNKRYEHFIGRDEFFTNFEFDELDFIKGTDMRFTKLISIDDDYSMFSLKLASRAKAPKTKISQSVEDYVELIDRVRNDLQAQPELLTFYNQLTPGYQKSWARFIYGTTKEETREKRRQEARKILSLGFKSIDLYKQSLK